MVGGIEESPSRIYARGHEHSAVLATPKLLALLSSLASTRFCFPSSRSPFLYKWRDQLEPMEESEGSLLHNSRVATLRKEVSRLKRVLADKVVEVDFFRGALHKVEARRQGRGSSGEKASTTRSGR